MSNDSGGYCRCGVVGAVRMKLLARLRQGPLAADDFAEVAVSKGSLRARICKLRDQGFEIETAEIPNGNRRPKAKYYLHAGTCPCCQRDFA